MVETRDVLSLPFKTVLPFKIILSLKNILPLTTVFDPN